RRPRPSPLFPYTTLFRSHPRLSDVKRAPLLRRPSAKSGLRLGLGVVTLRPFGQDRLAIVGRPLEIILDHVVGNVGRQVLDLLGEDRKSTRLNSSHVKSSY